MLSHGLVFLSQCITKFHLIFKLFHTRKITILAAQIQHEFPGIIILIAEYMKINAVFQTYTKSMPKRKNNANSVLQTYNHDWGVLLDMVWNQKKIHWPKIGITEFDFWDYYATIPRTSWFFVTFMVCWNFLRLVDDTITQNFDPYNYTLWLSSNCKKPVKTTTPSG